MQMTAVYSCVRILSLVRHGKRILEDVPRSFEGIKKYLEEHCIEGIVFWKGGKIHRICPSVIHHMRGQVFLIDEKKLFAFGGARSHDISGGILEPDDPEYRFKKKELDKGWEPYRINHVSWWAQEMPSEEEKE